MCVVCPSNRSPANLAGLLFLVAMFVLVRMYARAAPPSKVDVERSQMVDLGNLNQATMY